VKQTVVALTKGFFPTATQKVFRRDAFGNVSAGPTGNANFKNKSENYTSNNKEKIRFG
jgi:hypothetical protein